MSLIAVFGATSVAFAQDVPSFNVSLGFGSTEKVEVMKLQQFLFDGGYLPVAPTGLFLSLTQKAVMAFQSTQSVSPVSGFFGPLSRAAANAKVASTAKNATTLGSVSMTNTNTGTASAVLAGQRTITWQSANYPANVGVNINLLRKVSANPAQYSLVRVIAKDTPNDGAESWTPLAGETGSDMYIEVTCSTTNKFPNGCKLGNNIIPAN